MPSLLVKRSSAADNLLFFLVSAAASVLLTRIYLYIFNYPQIGNGTFHIAHAVIGGILLTMSVLLVLSFHGKRIRQLSSVVGGWGFGQFIDEIGKFITRDNDYFYQPVPVIIYLSFITVFFLYRRLEKYTPKDPQEQSYDILEQLEDLADNRFYRDNRLAVEETSQKILESEDKSHRYFARGIEAMMDAIPVRSTPPQNRLLTHLRSSWQWLDDFTAERRPVFYALIGIFLIYTGLTFWTMSAFFLRLSRSSFDFLSFGFTTRAELFVYSAEIISQALSAVWMCQGFWHLLRRRRQKALQLFKNGLAINILITHVFAFYTEQFSAAISLFIVLILFVLVENILEEEPLTE